MRFSVVENFKMFNAATPTSTTSPFALPTFCIPATLSSPVLSRFHFRLDFYPTASPLSSSPAFSCPLPYGSSHVTK